MRLYSAIWPGLLSGKKQLLRQCYVRDLWMGSLHECAVFIVSKTTITYKLLPCALCKSHNHLQAAFLCGWVYRIVVQYKEALLTIIEGLDCCSLYDKEIILTDWVLQRKHRAQSFWSLASLFFRPIHIFWRSIQYVEWSKGSSSNLDFCQEPQVHWCYHAFDLEYCF